MIERAPSQSFKWKAHQSTPSSRESTWLLGAPRTQNAAEIIVTCEPRQPADRAVKILAQLRKGRQFSLVRVTFCGARSLATPNWLGVTMNSFNATTGPRSAASAVPLSDNASPPPAPRTGTRISDAFCDHESRLTTNLPAPSASPQNLCHAGEVPAPRRARRSRRPTSTAPSSSRHKKTAPPTAAFWRRPTEPWPPAGGQFEIHWRRAHDCRHRQTESGQKGYLD